MQSKYSLLKFYVTSVFAVSNAFKPTAWRAKTCDKKQSEESFLFTLRTAPLNQGRLYNTTHFSWREYFWIWCPCEQWQVYLYKQTSGIKNYTVYSGLHLEQ